MYAPKRALQEEVNGEIKYYDDIVKKFDEVLKGAIEAKNKAIATDNKSPTPDTDIRYSIRRTSGMTWEAQINGYLFKTGAIKRSDSLVLNNFSETIVSKNDLPNIVPAYVLTKARSGKDESHSIKDSTLKNLEKDIENWSIAIEGNGSVTYVFNSKHETMPVFASFLQDSEFDNDKGNILRSIHLRKDIEKTIKALAGNYNVYIRNNELRTSPRSLLQAKTLTTNAKLILIDDTTSPDSSQVQSSARDTEYLELAKEAEKNEARLREMVETTARNEGYDSPKLYHGTRFFGWTKYNDRSHAIPFIYTSTNNTVSAHYAGDNYYASVRNINKKYDGGNDINSIISDAESVYESKYHKMTEKEKSERYAEIKAKAADVEEKINDLSAKVNGTVYDWNTDYGEEIGNAIAYVEDIFFTMVDGDIATYDEYVNDDYGFRKSFLNSIAKWEESEQKVKKYFDDNVTKMSAEEKALVRYLTGYELGDVAIDIIYSVGKILGNDVLLVNEGGSIAVPSELRQNLDMSHNIGSYQFYGNVGNNPYVFDANGAQFFAIKNPDIGEGVYSTDDIAKWAYENGYTSVIMKNIYDYGDKADNYVFFNASQIKSADPVTYDDNGNVIPLSERFNSGNGDIRYSARDSEGNTLSKAQQDYFRDSKVRDENGNLRVVYHGTDADFTVFDETRIGQNYPAYSVGGFYFTSNKRSAEYYGKNGKVLKGYLNLTNPYFVDLDNMKNWDGSPADYYNAADWYDNKAFEIDQMAKKAGNDGIYIKYKKGDLAIAFNSNQFKNVDNTSPTENPDIRYMVRTTNSDVYVDNVFDEFSKEDTVKFYEKIGEIKAGKKGAFRKAANGDYILEINNKLVYTDGRYNNPKITQVIEFNSEYENTLTIARGVIYEEERKNKAGISTGYREALHTIELAFGEQFVTVYKNSNTNANGWQNGRGKRSNSSRNSAETSTRQREWHFGDDDSESRVKSSSRPNDAISNEELLSDAIRLVEEGHIRPSKDESNTLASLKDTVQTLTTKKMELALLNKEWYSLNFMPKESRTPAQQNRLNEINKVRSELQKEISAGERDILDSKDKKTLVNVLKAARSENIRKGRLLKGYYENQKYHGRHYKLIREKPKVLLRS